MASKRSDPAAERLAHPEKWVTGAEPMTDAQEAYANTLARQAGEKKVDEDLTKAEASKKIGELKRRVGLPDTPASGAD
jgi:hypothetical protein